MRHFAGVFDSGDLLWQGARRFSRCLHWLKAILLD